MLDYTFGHLNIIPWNEDYKNFDYIKQPIKEEEITEWREQGYYHKSFSGAMYSSTNPMPDWVEDVSKELHLKKCGYVFYKMDTLDIMPIHTDHYETYSKVFEVPYNKVSRAIVFLEDWKSGHYFEIDNQAFTGWKKGDYAMWREDAPHAASNIGIEPRYTLQITGVHER